jgi:hypothetical protein
MEALMFGPAHAACLGSKNKARFGYNPDQRIGVRKHVGELLSSTGRLGASLVAVDKRSTNGTVLNQGQTGSCGGHGTVKVIRTAILDGGGSLPAGVDDFSPGYVYRAARRVSTPATFPDVTPLTDSGIDPEALDTCIPLVGFVPIGTDSQCPTPDGRYSDVWGPNDGSAPPNVNTDLQLDAEVAGRVNLNVTPYDIDISQGTAQVGQTFAIKGVGVGLGIFVDTPFMNWNPANGPLTGTCNLNDPNGGGHWVDEAELFFDADGKPVWGILNSWDKTWGDSGYIVVADQWLASSLSQAVAMKVVS